MKRRPRKISEGIITKSMIVRLLLMGSVITIGTLSMYLWSLYRSGWTWGQELLSASPDYVYAITMAFTTLVVFEMVNALASKSEEKSFFSGLFDNKWLLLAILSSLLLQAIIIYTPLNAYFHTTALLLTDLAIIFAAATSVIIADSVYKMFRARGSQA